MFIFLLFSSCPSFRHFSFCFVLPPFRSAVPISYFYYFPAKLFLSLLFLLFFIFSTFDFFLPLLLSPILPIFFSFSFYLPQHLFSLSLPLSYFLCHSVASILSSSLPNCPLFLCSSILPSFIPYLFLTRRLHFLFLSFFTGSIHFHFLFHLFFLVFFLLFPLPLVTLSFLSFFTSFYLCFPMPSLRSSPSFPSSLFLSSSSSSFSSFFPPLHPFPTL